MGWQHGPRDKPSLEYRQDARFVTIFEDQVFAQVGDIHKQGGQPGKAHVAFSKSYSIWSASIGTDGRLVSQMSDEPEPSEVGVRSLWRLAG